MITVKVSPKISTHAEVTNFTGIYGEHLFSLVLLFIPDDSMSIVWRKR